MTKSEYDPPDLMSGRFPTPHYPNNCLECPEILREEYGCRGRQACIGCIAADKERQTRFALG